MSETYQFIDVQPVKRTGRQGAGRRPEPNPFTEGVRSIIGKTLDDGTAKPAGAPFSLDSERSETLKQRHSRIRRFLTRAGKELAEADSADRPYRISMHISENTDPEIAGDYIVRFWHSNA